MGALGPWEVEVGTAIYWVPMSCQVSPHDFYKDINIVLQIQVMVMTMMVVVVVIMIMVISVGNMY